jgi:hypothetical protein
MVDVGQDREDPEGPDKERDETEAEREDRKWNDMLQELRVIQTSAQLTAGFLLTLPFSQRFTSLSDSQEGFYLALVLLSALVVALVLTPVAIHRRLAGLRIKGKVVAAGAFFMRLALALLATLVAGIVTFIFDVLVDRTAAVATGAVLAVVLTGLLFVLPRTLIRR